MQRRLVDISQSAPGALDTPLGAILSAPPSTGTYQIDQSHFTVTQQQTGADDKPVVVLYRCTSKNRKTQRPISQKTMMGPASSGVCQSTFRTPLRALLPSFIHSPPISSSPDRHTHSSPTLSTPNIFSQSVQGCQGRHPARQRRRPSRLQERRHREHQQRPRRPRVWTQRSTSNSPTGGFQSSK